MFDTPVREVVIDTLAKPSYRFTSAQSFELPNTMEEKPEEITFQYNRQRRASKEVCQAVLSVDQTRSSEVDSLRHHHGMNLDDALDVVGLEFGRHRESPVIPIWIPSPEHIEAETMRIRSGELRIEGQQE